MARQLAIFTLRRLRNASSLEATSRRHRGEKECCAPTHKLRPLSCSLRHHSRLAQPSIMIYPSEQGKFMLLHCAIPLANFFTRNSSLKFERSQVTGTSLSIPLRTTSASCLRLTWIPNCCTFLACKCRAATLWQWTCQHRPRFADSAKRDTTPQSITHDTANQCTRVAAEPAYAGSSNQYQGVRPWLCGLHGAQARRSLATLTMR